MDEVSWEYIAGFFDGEGYISIQKASAKSHSGARYWLIASLCNTQRSVLEAITKTTGGSILYHSGGKAGWESYRLTFYTRQAYEFLKKVYPFLILKKDEADIAIEFAEYTTQFRYTGVMHGQAVRDKQDQLHERLKQLHGHKRKYREAPHVPRVVTS
jgi:LAGLIDADG endonuclease